MASVSWVSPAAVVMGCDSGDIQIMDVSANLAPNDIDCDGSVLVGHMAAVLRVFPDELLSNHLYSASHDKTIRYWDIETGTPLRTFQAVAPVDDMVQSKNILFSTSAFPVNTHSRMYGFSPPL